MVGGRLAAQVVSFVLLALAVLMLAPAGVDLARGDWADAQVFVVSAAVVGFVGGGLALSAAGPAPRLGRREMFLMTTATWVAACLAGAAPLYFSSENPSLADAMFESVSGLTTTGATVMTGLQFLPPGVLLWRGFLQWFGGVGIIATAIAVLPALRVGGMQLFQSESSDRSEKLFPRAREVATGVSLVYIALTALCALLYWVAGMTGFDAVVHAMTTVATAGFSTHDHSFAQFASPALEWIAIVFMMLGALPLVLYLETVLRRGRPIWRSSQVRAFFLICGFATAGLAIHLVVSLGEEPVDAIRQAAFNAISVITTTGYASADYMTWGETSVSIFLLLTFCGGCTGSTTGGIKVFRYQMLGRVLRIQFARLIEPHGVVSLRYEGRRVSEEIGASVAAFIFVMLASVGLLTIGVAACGLDMLTSLSGAASAVMNVGPGLGEIIGPAGTYAPLPDEAKWMLTFGMLLGRLEMLTVLVLLSPAFWRG